jgi:hypothetical protein
VDIAYTGTLLNVQIGNNPTPLSSLITPSGASREWVLPVYMLRTPIKEVVLFKEMTLNGRRA